MKKSLVAIFVGGLLLSSCGKNDDDSSGKSVVKQDGKTYCSSDFVSDYNNISHEAQMLLSSAGGPLANAEELSKRLVSVNNACDKFLKKHSGFGECEGEKDYKNVVVKETDVKEACAQLKEGLKKMNGNTSEGEVSSGIYYNDLPESAGFLNTLY